MNSFNGVLYLFVEIIVNAWLVILMNSEICCWENPCVGIVHPKVPKSLEVLIKILFRWIIQTGLFSYFCWFFLDNSIIDVIIYESLKKFVDINFSYTVMEGMTFIRKPEYHPYLTEWTGQLYNLASHTSSYGSNYPRKFGDHPFQLPEQTKEYILLGSSGK